MLQNLPYEILPNKFSSNETSNTYGSTLNKQDCLFKLIIIGSSGVGKSSLMKRITENEFNLDHEVTIGVEFGSLMIKVEDVAFKVQIWDTAGQEAF